MYHDDNTIHNSSFHIHKTQILKTRMSDYYPHRLQQQTSWWIIYLKGY